MNKISPIRYEKVDDTTVRVIAEKIDDIDINILLKNKAIMEENVKQYESKLKIESERLNQINTIITEAEKIGVVSVVSKVTEDKSKTK